MSFFSWFKTVPKALDITEDIVTGGIAGIDKIFFTDEEKSDARRKTFELWLKLQEIIKGECTARSITRRFLACMIMGEFLLFLLMAALCWPLMPEWSKFLLELGKSLGNLVLAVSIFYFGPYALGTYLKKKKD